MNFASIYSPMFSSPAFIWVVAVWVITAVVHIAFAIAVLYDSRRIHQTQRRGTFLVGGGVWALAVLLGGVVAAGIYWAIHHSTLQKPPEP